MKKYFLAAILMLFCIPFAFSQINLNNPNIDAIMLNQGAGTIFRNSKKSQGEKILGSPYQQIMFAPAKVGNISGQFNMRYNNYEDQFEFISSKGDTLILDKIDDFSNITFVGPNKKFKLVTYSNNTEKTYKGYLIELYQKGNFGIYKKEWISFYAGKKAKTSLEKDMPPRYNKEKESYFLKDNGGNILEFPESKKQLAKLFPEKKQAIDDFIKENKIDFDAEADRIKIINFLAQ